jgi:hypothetical protein
MVLSRENGKRVSGNIFKPQIIDYVFYIDNSFTFQIRKLNKQPGRPPFK